LARLAAASLSCLSAISCGLCASALAASTKGRPFPSLNQLSEKLTFDRVCPAECLE